MKKLKFKVDNVISKNVNLAVQGAHGPGVKTEVGSFWFCCNPDQPLTRSVRPVSLYVVNRSGVVRWYPNISSVIDMHRATVRKFLKNNEFYKDNLYIEESVFNKILPHVLQNVDLSTSFTITTKDLNKLITFVK